MAPKDRDRQGPGNVGVGNKSADKGGKSAGPAAKTKDKSGLGGFTSFRDMFDGGGPGKSRPSGPTAADRPRARPDVVKTGTGKDPKGPKKAPKAKSRAQAIAIAMSEAGMPKKKGK